MASIPLSQGGILKASCEVTLLFAACNTLALVEIAQLRYRVAAVRRGAQRNLSRTVRQYRQRFWRRHGWRCGWLRVNPIQIAKSFEFDNCVLHRRFAVNPAVLLDVFQYSFLVFLGALKAHALICSNSRVGFLSQLRCLAARVPASLWMRLYSAFSRSGSGGNIFARRGSAFKIATRTSSDNGLS